jgi:uncharacterized protein (DUF4415 family)
MTVKRRASKHGLTRVKRRYKGAAGKVRGLKTSWQPADLRALKKATDRLGMKATKRLRKSDASRSKWVDPDDAPEWTAEMFARADLYHGNRLIRRGRPPSDNPKKALKLRIDADVVEHFRATGPGWQTRINDALRRAAKLRKAG